MSAESSQNKAFDIVPAGLLPEGEDFKRNIQMRRRIGTLWRSFFLFSTVVGMVMLLMLGYNVVNNAFGGVAVQTRVDVNELTDGRELSTLSQPELVTLLEENLRAARERAIVRDGGPLADRDKEALEELVRTEILREEIVGSWPLTQFLFNRAAIETDLREEHPRAELSFRSWINFDFLTSAGSSNALIAGVRMAIFGSLWMILITMLIAIPLGISAAIYLEEYAPDMAARAGGKESFSYRAILWLNNTIQVNINNLAGVPSIIYGMLGLAIFVRALSPITSGAAFGVQGADPNVGRTVLSASMTMALLILPLIIINAQEAIRAVPNSIRQASLALGATKWQTIWNQVLPVAFPGILTGTILGMSRAIGETAPLVVVGAAAFITLDPNGPFSRFTALPIQIYQWTSLPNPEFRNLAAAAIITLLVLLLSLNSLAIYLRNRFQRRV
jgi:phosphate transport system permease protein